MDTRRIVGTTCLGNPIYETDPNLPPLTREEEIRHATGAGIFDCVEVGSDGKDYVASDEDGLYHPVMEDGYPDLSKKVPLPA